MKSFSGKKTNNLMGPKIVMSVVMAIIFFLSYSANLFSYIELSLQDMFFQNEKTVSEEIIVIGVTNDDLSTYGMWPWDRTTWANVLSAINSDEQTAPAAIGVSLSFSGSSQPISDELLTAEITKSNVILSCEADLISSAASGQLFSTNQQIEVIDMSYPFLYPNENIQLGHTNILLDSDGILRHGLLEITTSQGGVIGSMAYETYKTYVSYHEIDFDFDPVLDESGRWYVDYSADDNEYFHYSVSDILNGDFNQEDLTGKIVLIGVYDTTLMDYYRPSINHAENIYGVDFMANCINAMIDNVEIKEVRNITEMIVLFFSTFIITFIALNFSFKKVTIFTLSALSIGLIIIKILYNYAGMLYSPFYYIVGFITFYILAAIFNYWLEWYSKKHVTELFSQYVDPKVMEKLMYSDMENLHSAGMNCKIAVLFVDLRGFTSLSEKLDPENVVNILNSFLTLTDDCIKEFDGTLDKFIGDCTMAFWGAPNISLDPAYQACCAAIKMVESSTKLSDEIYQKYNKKISFGIGIHYGSAVVGNVGSKTRLDYTAIGDTVNTASRLESIAPANTIYISEEIAVQVENRADIEKINQKLSLKGKSEPIDVYILKNINKHN